MPESKLSKIMSYLSEVTLPTVIQAIESDHRDLRTLIHILKSETASHAKKKRAFTLFADLLQSHALSEERAVYAPSLKIPALRGGAREAEVEHAIAARLLEKAKRLRDPGRWAAHAKVLAELVEHHLDEEEREFLPALWSHASAQVREQMREAFLSLRHESQAHPTAENGGVLAA